MVQGVTKLALINGLSGSLFRFQLSSSLTRHIYSRKPIGGPKVGACGKCTPDEAYWNFALYFLCLKIVHKLTYVG